MSEALFVYADPNTPYSNKNTSIYRIATPAKYLRKAGHDITECYFSEIGDVPHTVLIERYLSSHQYGNVIERLRQAGAKRIVVTFDDNYALMPLNDYSKIPYQFWHDGDNLQRFRLGLRECDAVIVPSQKLADYYSDCKISVVPNYFDNDNWDLPNKPSKSEGDTVVIGWGGSAQHVLSWENAPILKALRMIQAEFDNTRLVIYGRHISDLLGKAGIRHEVREWCSFEDWGKRVAEFDIGLAPLKGEYDDYRSNIKVLEYGLAGVAPVWSKRPPYDGIPNKFGLACTTADDWYVAIKSLIVSSFYRQQIGLYYKTYAHGYMGSECVETYENILWK